jgi:tyrosyl-tRNA synthetase
MSKSLGNAIGITDPPEEIYGRTMSIPDESLPGWCALLARPAWDEVHALAERVEAGEGNPRDLKAALARRLVERFWGPEAARGAEEHFDRLFRRHETPEDMPEIDQVAGGPDGAELLDLLVSADFAASRSEAKRLIAQGGVRLDGARVSTADARVQPGEYVLQAGKRRFARIRVRPASD